MLKNYLETLLAFEENKQEVAISISDRRIFYQFIYEMQRAGHLHGF